MIRGAVQAMGTRFELILEDRGACDECIQEIIELDRKLSRFRSDSLLAHLRRAAPAPVAVDQDTFDLFRESLEIRRRAPGFEVLWRDGRGAGDVLVLDEDSCTIAVAPDVEIDFGSIAKGHALDLCASMIDAWGFERGFLHAGTSSVRAIGEAPGGSPWRVAIAGTAYVAELVNASLSVSSNDRAHILHPEGTVLSNAMCAVIHERARWADAWTTASIASGTMLQPGLWVGPDVVVTDPRFIESSVHHSDWNHSCPIDATS
ncbi:MAG: FAD:protein FMN transferase [Phycisphaerales bacterium]|nr:FAD:protein FMN transferase [Phycisphaerales bacterium]